MLDMIGWHRMLKDKKITLVYSGPLWSEGIGGIAGTLKRKLEFDNLPMETSQEVFSVFVEQMNNMLMYSAEEEQFAISDDEFSVSPKGTFIMGKDGRQYFIQTGNVVKNKNIDYMKSKIDYLNSLNKAELRKYYREQTKCPDDNPESKGVGLGFIEIARRISSKIEYSFVPFEEGFSFFTLYVTIGRENTDAL